MLVPKQSLIPKPFLTDSVFQQLFSLCVICYMFHHIVGKTIRPSHKMKLVEKLLQLYTRHMPQFIIVPSLLGLVGLGMFVWHKGPIQSLNFFPSA